MFRSPVSLHLLIHFGILLSLSIGEDYVTVTTKLGQIRGIKTPTVNKFLGVPYANPPVGNYRWQNPIGIKPWSPSTYDATETKPGCMQYGCKDGNPALVCPDMVSEDCLYLYIWTPSYANSSSSIPVMVYIHGGNFVHMSAGSLLFDGEYLSNKGDVIVVNVEYRLGAFGFLLTKDTEKGKGATGNYGILDQRLALKWVSENIQSFGGDPTKVTLFGQSAGAQSTVIHLTSPESGQYFHRAIVESAPISLPFKDITDMLFIGNMLADALNCTEGDLQCLKSKSAEDIAKAQHLNRAFPSSLRLLEFFEPWVPYVDGTIVPYEPIEAIRKGLFVRKPLMIGTLTEETRVFVYSGWKKPINAIEYSTALLLTFPTDIIDILSLYPPSADPDERDTLVVPSTDFVFTCCTRNYTRYAANLNNGSTWLYSYDHAFSFPGWGKFKFCEGHSCHGADIPIMFRSWPKGNYTATPEEGVLAEQIMIYWSNFAKHADPNVGQSSGLHWPKYSVKENWLYMLFQTPENVMGQNLRGPYCDFWDKIGYRA